MDRRNSIIQLWCTYKCVSVVLRQKKCETCPLKHLPKQDAYHNCLTMSLQSSSTLHNSHTVTSVATVKIHISAYRGASSLTAAAAVAVDGRLRKPKWAHPSGLTWHLCCSSKISRKMMMAIIGDFLSCVCQWGEEGIVVLCLIYVWRSTQGEMNCLSSGHCLDHLADCISALD